MQVNQLADIYTLTAELGDLLATNQLGAYSDEEATSYAIHVIMENAYEDKSGPWALGAITLTGPEGNVIHTMEAKK